jgi:hypothetical protein
MDFARWGHIDTATEKITHIITNEQLSGYTERSFPAIVDGHRVARRVQQTAFAKFVLRKTGKFYVFLFRNYKQQLIYFG